MGEALYRKYRPKSLMEVVGQPHITQTLENALKQGRISHGYLFSGPRGVGKTSIARILAHQINNFEYGDPRGALDIIEIDAASNRRIDEIRDLRDKVHIAPVTGKYKVYIIDEVHMLTREAFNALLKTLEEPPAHVVFILATTEAHKLPETIISRTQRYTFKPVSKKEVVAHLRKLAKEEKITISDDALGLIATHGEGSFRDSISLLDQLSGQNMVSEDDVRALLGLPPEKYIKELILATQNGKISQIIDILSNAEDSGYSASQISAALSKLIRFQLYDGNELFGKATILILEKLLTVNSSPSPREYLELILLDIVLTSKPAGFVTNQVSKPIHKSSVPKSDIEETVKTKKTLSDKTVQKTKKDNTAPKSIHKHMSGQKIEEALTNGLWDEVLNILKSKNNTLYGIARMVSPSVEDDMLVLNVPFAFHNKRLSEEKNSSIISSILLEQSGERIMFTTQIDESIKLQNNSEPTISPLNSDTIATVTEIFGGGEVLES